MNNNNINGVGVCGRTIKSQNLSFLFYSICIVCVCFCICIHACICIESPPSRGLEIIALGTRSLLLVIHYWVRSTPHDWPAYTFLFVFIHTTVLVLAVNIIGLNSTRLPCIFFCFWTWCQKSIPFGACSFSYIDFNGCGSLLLARIHMVEWFFCINASVGGYIMSSTNSSWQALPAQVINLPWDRS